VRFVLDTDHLTILERGGAPAAKLERKLLTMPAEDLFTTVVSYDEQMRGWLAEVARATSINRVVQCYERLELNLALFCDPQLLPFDTAAADRFQALRRGGVRIGTMDLRIASIALVQDATIVTRNLRDFEQVPGLTVENWCD
jgi:tRNA(fMet)-specific endonuclease VapC